MSLLINPIYLMSFPLKGHVIESQQPVGFITYSKRRLQKCENSIYRYVIKCSVFPFNEFLSFKNIFPSSAPYLTNYRKRCCD